MSFFDFINLIGMFFNVLASVIMLLSFLNIKKDVNDDYIVNMDKNGKYTQVKHLKDSAVGLLVITFYIIGLILQSIAIVYDK